SVSKIRFLESKGLIQPARSPSGYRRFDEADVERLRYILTAQRDQYLPLRVIKERLLPPPGADDGQLAELETFGLIRRVGRAYGQDALQVACAAAELGRFGVQPRHLRAVKA